MNHCRTLVFSASTLLAACGGSVGANDGSDGGTSGSGGGQTSQYPDDASYADVFTASQVQAAEARCNEPHGNVIDVYTQGDVKQLAAGSWLLCASSDPNATGTMFSPGIVFTPDGNWSRLMPDGKGGLVRMTGVQNQGSWQPACATFGPASDTQSCGENSVDLHLGTVGGDATPSGCGGGLVSFEDAPRRMYYVDDVGEWCTVQYTGPAIDIWLVPL